MREYTKSLEAIQEARDVDEENKHTSEIQQQEFKVQQALFSQRGEETQEQTLERAMRDPEVAVSSFLLSASPETQLLFPSFSSCSAGNHERPYYAANSSTSADRSQSPSGSHEEPRGQVQNTETSQCRYHQD